MKSVKYRLWAMPITDESIVFATEEDFARIGDGRVLTYLEDGEEPPCAAYEIDGEDLTENELRWLTKCNMTVIESVAKTYREPMERTLPEFLERLKNELEKARGAKDAEEAERPTEE